MGLLIYCSQWIYWGSGNGSKCAHACFVVADESERIWTRSVDVPLLGLRNLIVVMISRIIVDIFPIQPIPDEVISLLHCFNFICHLIILLTKNL